MPDERHGDGSRREGDPAAGLTRARHLGGFVLSGLLAFSVDAVVLEAGIRLLGLDPRVARLAAIAVAMVAAWLAHRRLTFAVPNRPSLGELARYAAAASSAAVINYLVFAAALSLWPALPAFAALVASTGAATIFSYIALRYAVFQRTP